MLGKYMHSRVGFGNYGNLEYGFGQPGMDMGPPSLQLDADAPDTRIPSVMDDSRAMLEVVRGREVSDAELLEHEAKVERTSNPNLTEERAREIAREKLIAKGQVSWFSVLPMQKKLAIFGLGFGALLIVIFAIKS